MIRSFLCAATLIPCASFAGASASYTLDPLANSSGGTLGSSVAYSLTGSTTPGVQGGSSTYDSRGGYAGQLGFFQGLMLFAAAADVEEEEDIQLGVAMSFDDGTSFPMAATDFAWSVESGPIAAISATGLASAAAVYEDSAATVHATNGTLSANLTLMVLEADSDNYDNYAADGLPDAWQVLHFGVGSLKGGQNDDFDDDRVLNLVEFASGTNPADSTSGAGPLRLSGNVLESAGTPLVEYAPAPNVLDHRVLFIRRKDAGMRNLIYAPQFSRNLSTWSNATTPQTIIADDGTYEVVSVRFPVLIGGQRSASKFFRMNLSIAPPP